jgi:hypothetical protein
MGYTTEFEGKVDIVPPLNEAEIAYLNKFSDTRRMDRTKGPYYVDGTGLCGQGRDNDIIDFNNPPPGQPGLWCQWVPTDDGTAIEWNGSEKFYCADAWMRYIIDHFLSPTAVAKNTLDFLQANHVVNGEIEASGEDSDDHWKLIVKNNKVLVKQGRIVYK